MLTALDIARGLEYLHHPSRRLVHCDMSAANILLATHSDERGFRALLSDFGGWCSCAVPCVEGVCACTQRAHAEVLHTQGMYCQEGTCVACLLSAVQRALHPLQG